MESGEFIIVLYVLFKLLPWSYRLGSWAVTRSTS